MPNYLIYKGKPGGTSARGQNAWKKDELLQEARRYGLDTHGTLTQVCQRLLDYEKTQVMEAPLKVTAPAPTKVQIKAPERKKIPVRFKRKNSRIYKNETTLLDESVDSLSDDEIIPIDGYCFLGSELFQTLKESKRNSNPYTNQPLWADRQSFDQLINHPTFTPDDRYILRSIFFPEFDPRIIKLVNQHTDIFNLIGMTGAVLKADFSTDFKASLSMLSVLSEAISKKPPNIRDQFDQLKTCFSGHKTLKEIRKNPESQCIHGIGSSILGIYLHTWFSLPEENRPPLIQPLYRGIVKTTVFLGYTEDNKYFHTYLFKYDTDMGKIHNSNFIRLNMSTQSWSNSDGYPSAKKVIEPDLFQIIEDDAKNNTEAIMINFTAFHDYLNSHKYELL